MCQCVFGTSTVHTGGVGGERGWRAGSQRKASAPGGVCLLPLGLLEGATHADSRRGRGSWWGQNRRGARPALALSLTGSGQCPAAKGRGPAYAHKLISSESAGPPAQSGCLHCGPRALSCRGEGGGWGWKDRGRKGELRGRQRGRERRPRQGGSGGGSM